jgi:glycolate oxidase FAD binding subunit
VEVLTAGLNRVVEHNAGDLTAVLQAGVPVTAAQEAFAAAGQMLALDPPVTGTGDTAEPAATIGGVVATADSGPLRHRYGAPRDLLLGITVALSDGTLARAGSKVIKNVAGYDLPKLFAGSFGTLGVIVEVVVRLHPRPDTTARAVGRSVDPDAVQKAALTLSHASLQMDCLDIGWHGGVGEILGRFGGRAAETQAQAAARLMERLGLDAGVEEDDEGTWERQRQRQRSESGAVVKVSSLPAQMGRVIRAAEASGGSLVGRAGLGLFWVELPRGGGTDDLVAAVHGLRRELAPSPCAVLDAPAEVRERVDVWGNEPSASVLMGRLKEGFDPLGILSPGIFVAGI